MQGHIFKAVGGVIKARTQTGAIAFILLIWVALQSFLTLTRAINRAWEAEEYHWWRQPLKSLVLLGITAGAVLLGMAVSVLLRMAKGWAYPLQYFNSWGYDLGSFSLPIVLIFLSLSLFYMYAPRRPTRFTEVWASALLTTILLRSGDILFVIYLKHFATLNAVYGAFGGIISLLLWIYVSGCIIIFGACLCAGQSDVLKLHRK
jgi:YihY family inner membrane protein